MSLLHGRRGPAPVRPDDAVGAPRQVPDVGADAGRRRRRDHAVELPDRDPVVEARAGARLRQHRRAQAGRGHAAARPSASSSCSPRRACPTGVVNIVHGYGEEAGERLVRHPDVRVITLHGLARDRRRRCTKAAADNLKHVHLELGGKNAIIVHRRRRPRPRGRRASSGRRSAPRASAAPRRAASSSTRPSTTSCSAARRARRAAAARPGLGGRHRRRPRDQPRRAREDPLLHARSARTRARSCSPAARSRPRATSARASTTGRRCSPTSSPQMRIAQEEIFGPTTALIPVARLRRGGPRRERDPLRALVLDLHARREQARSARCATSQTGITYVNAGTTAPRCTCRSAARRRRATATARRGRPRSTSSPSGSRSTSTTPGKLQRAQIDNA